MKRREKLTDEERVALALELIKSDGPLAEVCARFNVSHTTAYKIRSAFLRGGREAVMGRRRARRVDALWERVARLERAVNAGGLVPRNRSGNQGRNGRQGEVPRPESGARAGFGSGRETLS